MEDVVEFPCPWCFEGLSLYVDPETRGEMVQDCDVCCRPITLRVERDAEGNPRVQADRS